MKGNEPYSLESLTTSSAQWNLSLSPQFGSSDSELPFLGWIFARLSLTAKVTAGQIFFFKENEGKWLLLITSTAFLEVTGNS